MAGESSRTKDGRRVQGFAAKESTSAEKVHVEHLEGDCATEAEKRQRLLAERREVSLTARL